MMRTCVFPGSFDPITLGHVDMIRRAAACFDRVIVAVLHNPDKTGAFSVEERLDMIRLACEEIPGVEVDAFGGLLADYLRQTGIRTVVRGLRNDEDFAMECPMAQLNRHLYPDMDTFFLMTDPALAHISSSAVKQIASFGGSVAGLVPPRIEELVSRRFSKS